MLKPFFQWYRDNFDDEIPEKEIPATWFAERKLPMVVHCAECEMTMALPEAWIDRQGYTYCRNCAGVDE